MNLFLLDLGMAVLIALANAAAKRETLSDTPLQLEGSGRHSRIQFGSLEHDFGKVKSGGIVRHEFVFTNTGNAVLELAGVHPSCSACVTIRHWSQRVEPQKAGSIVVEFNSSHFMGPVTKAAHVACNDPLQSRVTLQLRATVWQPLEVSPQVAVLTAVANSTNVAVAVVRIVSHEDAPITVSKPKIQNPAFAAEIKAVKPGREFELHVKTIPPLPLGDLRGQISVNTSSTNVPIVNVTAFAMVQSPLKVMPLQITVPAIGKDPVRRTVSIRNNAGRSVTLSDAKVNAPGVDVEVREVEPGRQFMITVIFPPGLKVAPDGKLELSIKSSHPDLDFIKVPIVRSAAVDNIPPIVP